MRAVHKDNVGKYYAGFDGEVKWVESPDLAEQLEPEDAASIAMGMIDTQLTVVVPEVFGNCTEEDRTKFIDQMACGCFQDPSSITKSMVARTIRDSANDPIHPQNGPESSNTFMSVWEWVFRGMVAKFGDDKDEKAV